MFRLRTSVLAVLLAATSIPAAASPITFVLGDFVSGTAPTSSAPWLTMTFADTGAGAVRLTVQSDLDVASEFIDNLVFNVHSSIDPLAVLFSENAGLRVGAFQSPAISRSANGESLPPSGGFDFDLDFASSNSNGGVKRFNLTDRLVYDLTCSVGLDTDCASFAALSFNVTNVGGSLYAATHYQGIPAGAGSGKFGDTTGYDPGGEIAAVPEPATLLLFGTGVGAVALGRRMKRRT